VQLSFRWRLFLALSLAVLVGTTVDAVVDYFERSEMRADSAELALNTVQRFALAALSFDSDTPSLNDSAQNLPGVSRFRLVRGGELVLEASNLTGEEELIHRQNALPDGYTLELSVDPRSLEGLFGESLREDLTDDGPQIILSVLIAWTLALLLLRPVVRLNRAINAVSTTFSRPG